MWCTCLKARVGAVGGGDDVVSWYSRYTRDSRWRLGEKTWRGTTGDVVRA